MNAIFKKFEFRKNYLDSITSTTVLHAFYTILDMSEYKGEELFRDIINNVTDAQLRAYKNRKKPPSWTINKKAGLIFPIESIYNLMTNYAPYVEIDSAIYLTGYLEYMSIELINICKANSDDFKVALGKNELFSNMVKYLCFDLIRSTSPVKSPSHKKK